MPLPKPASKEARKMIKRAFKDLEKTINPSEARNFSTTTLPDVRKACLAIENDLACRESLRNMRRLMPLFAGLGHYGKSIEVLCNGTPFLPWIWAPITLILRIASDYADALEKIIKAYGRIGQCLGRFELLRQTFLEDNSFQEILATFYCHILGFHKTAYKFVKRSNWKTFFFTTWGRFEREFDTIIESLKSHADLIDKEGNVRNIKETQLKLQSIDMWRQQALDRIEREDKERSVKEYQALMARLQIDDSEQLAILNSLTEELKVEGTCQWALDNEAISSWLDKKGDVRLLWLSGPPGMGKSVLAAYLIENHQSQVLFHFCHDGYARSKKYDQVLKSLIRQLAQRSCEEMAHAYKTFILDTKNKPTTAALERLVRDLLTMVSGRVAEDGPVWIILDGVDECESNKLASLLSLAKSRTSESSAQGDPVCKILLASRHHPTMKKSLATARAVSLSADPGILEPALRLYVRERLEQSGHKLSQMRIGFDLMKEIENKIVGKADGMFLYARLIIDYITAQLLKSSEELILLIETLPPKLEEFYATILNQLLINKDETSIERIKCIFRWVSFLKRPLRRLEFLSAVTFSDGDLLVEDPVPQYFLESCGALIHERHDTSITFIHTSVKQFLQSPACRLHITEEDALREQVLATLSCLTSASKFLNTSQVPQSLQIQTIRGLYGLVVYAAEFWPEYVMSWAESRAGDIHADPVVSFSLRSFVERLESTVEDTEEIIGTENDDVIGEERLSWLQNYPLLHRYVSKALTRRSQAWLEQSFVDTEDGVNLEAPRPKATEAVSQILEAYQAAVRDLLKQDHFPGVSAAEFELFKSHFGNSSFTCRLRTCPYATIGFPDEGLLKNHELSHSRRLRWCQVEACHYPPFLTLEALRCHVNKHHTYRPGRRRSVREIPTAQVRGKNERTFALRSRGGDDDIGAQLIENGIEERGMIESNEPLLLPQHIGDIKATIERASSLKLMVGVIRIGCRITREALEESEKEFRVIKDAFGQGQAHLTSVAFRWREEFTTAKRYSRAWRKTLDRIQSASNDLQVGIAKAKTWTQARGSAETHMFLADVTTSINSMGRRIHSLRKTEMEFLDTITAELERTTQGTIKERKKIEAWLKGTSDSLTESPVPSAVNELYERACAIGHGLEGLRSWLAEAQSFNQGPSDKGLERTDEWVDKVRLQLAWVDKARMELALLNKAIDDWDRLGKDNPEIISPDSPIL